MKKRMKKIIALTMIATMAVSLVAGCGKKEEEGKTKDGKIHLRFATWDDGETLDSQQECVDKFNESQDEIEVTIEAYGNDFDTKLTASMGAGDAPDVMYMWDYPTYADSLEPLDELIAAEGEEYKNNFYEALWPYNSKNDQIYGIPVSVVTSCLYYNKDIFDQAGVAYPTDDWTWEDLQNASKEIQEKVEGVNGFTFGMKTLPYTFEMYLWSNGTAVVDSDGKMDGNINSKESVEVFQMFQNMEKEGVAYAAEKGVSSEFLGGNTAMYVDGTWPMGSLDEAGVNYCIAQISKFEGQDSSRSVINTCGIAISKDTANKEAAWEFVKFWTGEEMNKYRINTELPALKSVFESEGLEANEKYAPFYTALENCAGYVPASFIVDDWSEVDSDVSLAIESVFNPSSYADPQEMLDEVVANHE